MTKANRITRLRLAIDSVNFDYYNGGNVGNRILIDYFHAVNEEAIELQTKTGTLAGMHRAAMVRVMRRIGINVRL